MKYSLLIYEANLDEDKEKKLQDLLPMFIQDDNCSQIVIGCSGDWIVRLSQKPLNKTMFAQMPKTNYSSLLTGLKAISEDTVLIGNLKGEIKKEDVEGVIEALGKYPAIRLSESLQGFDTRLLMFSLQVSIEMNYAMDNYEDVVKLAGTPIRQI